MKRCTAILVVTFVPSAVCAQETPQRWPGLVTSGLSTVYVLDDTGVETSGRLLRLNPDSLVLLVRDAELRLEAARVRRVQARGDSLRNGALIGGVMGVGMGLIAAGISDCPGDDPGGSCPGFRAAALLGSTGVYAGIGAGVDALVVGRTTLYEVPTAPPRSAAPSYRGGTAISLRFHW
jgi:hypothetical protein